ncbi:MAG TPA: efflux RND transporter permease subunit [Methylophilaceae bacterium]|jgi:HAE1 family hydrophobic/amphiphilic exporter-1
MSFKISSWAIKQPLAPFVFFVGFLLAGLVAYTYIPVNGMPSVKIPIVNVSVVLAGSTPTIIESEITRRIEASVSGIGGIKHMASSATADVSNTQLEFELGTDINDVLSKVRDQVASIRPLLPHDVEEPIVQKIDVDVVPILTFTVNSPNHSIEETSWLVDSEISRALLSIKGVAKVQRQGGLEQEIKVELDAARLQAYNISVSDVNEQIRKTVLTLPSGRLENTTQELLIKSNGAPKDIESLANTQISLPNGNTAKLIDLGSVRYTTAQQHQLARFNHQPVVAFAIYKSNTASEIEVETKTLAKLAQFKASHPTFEFNQIQSTVDYAKQTYHSALWSFIEGAILAGLAVYVFLRNWRATWITATVIPLSVIPTFAIMHALGFSLNLVSLLALSLVSGILVDDAIVEVENIMRHLRMGKTPYQAAMDAADEIGLAVIATTLVIVAVFTPVSFMGGIVGQYFIQFGLTVAVATIFSLFVARLITPVLSAYFLQAQIEAQSQPSWLARYLSWVQKSLTNRPTTLLIGMFIILGTIYLATQLPTDFMPNEDKSQSTLQVELAPGSKITDTDAVVSMITNLLRQKPEVKSVYAIIGGADSETNVEGEVRKAKLLIQLVAPAERKLSAQEFEQSISSDLSKIPNARMSFLNENGNKALSFSLVSDQPEELVNVARALEIEMNGLPQLSNVSASTPSPRTELTIVPRPTEAAQLGVSTEAIAETVRLATLGDNNTNLLRVNLNNRQVPARISLDANARTSLQEIEKLLVPSNQGTSVPLSAVADIQYGTGPSSIERFKQQRQITLEANLHNATLGEALEAINQLPSIKKMPSSVKRFDTGDAELLDEMFNSFVIAMMAGVTLVLAILILLFRKLLQPFTIMAALPLSIAGALIGLSVAQLSLSLPAIIGILMLMGIVGKNGILLIDCIAELRALGLARQEAIFAACEQRAQPIIMTSFAMIAGMLPILFGLGAGNAFRMPMAIAVIGGLIASTALSLLFIPLIYTLVDDFEAWLSPKLKSLTTLKS